VAERDDDVPIAWPANDLVLAPFDTDDDEHEDEHEADLSAGLAGLAGLVTGLHGLEELLARVATFAARAIPGADGAGVMLMRPDGANLRVQAFAASVDVVAMIDQIQYDMVDEGPCITAARERRTVSSGSLGGERLWPRFGPRVARLGVHSALSLPLIVNDCVIGAINVYGRAKNVFDESAAHIGELFAVPAAVAVYDAQLLADARTTIEQLQTALESRPIIDQAIGLIRGRTGANPTEAFDRLRHISQTENVKLRTIAQRIVDDAVRRARALHADSRPGPAGDTDDRNRLQK
jgi:transcriptional regulator with GAF, ATPase, and Fis domain